MTVYTIFKEYTWLVNTIHHAGNHTPGQESCDSKNAAKIHINNVFRKFLWKKDQ